MKRNSWMSTLITLSFLSLTIMVSKHFTYLSLRLKNISERVQSVILIIVYSNAPTKHLHTATVMAWLIYSVSASNQYPTFLSPTRTTVHIWTYVHTHTHVKKKKERRRNAAKLRHSLWCYCLGGVRFPLHIIVFNIGIFFLWRVCVASPCFDAVHQRVSLYSSDASKRCSLWSKPNR